MSACIAVAEQTLARRRTHNGDVVKGALRCQQRVLVLRLKRRLLGGHLQAVGRAGEHMA